VCFSPSNRMLSTITPLLSGTARFGSGFLLSCSSSQPGQANMISKAIGTTFQPWLLNEVGCSDGDDDIRIRSGGPAVQNRDE